MNAQRDDDDWYPTARQKFSINSQTDASGQDQAYDDAVRGHNRSGHDESRHTQRRNVLKRMRPADMRRTERRQLARNEKAKQSEKQIAGQKLLAQLLCELLKRWYGADIVRWNEQKPTGRRGQPPARAEPRIILSSIVELLRVFGFARTRPTGIEGSGDELLNPDESDRAFSLGSKIARSVGYEISEGAFRVAYFKKYEDNELVSKIHDELSPLSDVMKGFSLDEKIEALRGLLSVPPGNSEALETHLEQLRP